MRRTKALLLLLVLSATACAGDVVRYRKAAVGPDGVTILAGAPAGAAGAAGGSAGINAAAGNPVGTAVTDTTVPATTTTVSAAVAAAGVSAAPGLTVVSGPAARLRRPSAGTAAAGNRSAAGPGAGPAAGPDSTPAAGSGPTAGPTGGGSGGAGPAVPAPAPVPGSGTTTGVTKDTITIGVFYPKTGYFAGIARNAPAVTQAAFDEAGPINGRRVVLKYYDDGSANAGTIQVEEKRAKDDVFALISVVGESNVVLAPLADQHKVPLFLGNIDQKVGVRLTYAFPLYAYWAHQATILPGFIRNALGAGTKKIGVVFEGTSTAIDAKNIFKEKAKEAGLSVVFEQPIAQNQSACANEVSNLEAHGVELAVMINGPLGGICMLRDAKALGYKPAWTGVSPSWGFNVVSQASGGGADGTRMLRVTPTLESPEGRHYSEIMRRAAPNSGADNDDVLLILYALVRSTIEGVRRAGPDLSREGLVQTWETKMNGYESGYLPPPTFGPGNRSGPLVVGVSACCTNGQWTTPQPGWRAAF